MPPSSHDSSGDPPGALSPDELERYGRHLALPEVGEQGQLRLRGSSVLLVGLGGLGCPAGMYLAAAGIGRLGLCDHDRVDKSNLQRQVLYTTGDIGRDKAAVASARLRALNPHVSLEEHVLRLTAENADTLLQQYEIVVDGSDNFATRYAISDACVRTGRALVSGSLERFRAQVAVFAPPDGPCYRCLYPQPPAPGSAPNCSAAGVIGVLPGLVGVLQAAEALKLALGRGRSLAGRLLTIDLLAVRFGELSLRKDPACPACGEHRSPSIPVAPSRSCGPGRAAEADDVPPSISPGELRKRLARPAGRRIQLLDVRMPWEWDRGHLEGAVLVPLQELSGRLEELDPGLETVVYCAVGERSAYAVKLLLAAGFSRARNLEGGLRAWDVLGDDRIDGS